MSSNWHIGLFWGNVALCAVNASFFVWLGEPLNMGAAVINAFCALWLLAGNK